MSYAKSLRNTLKDRNEALYNRLQPIENAAKSVLTYTASKFPYYTPHDFSHSQHVEEILNWLVPDATKPDMNDYEMFFILVAAWLHDWGMVASEGENAEEVRRLHHIRTEANFEKLYEKIQLSLTEARIIGRICRGHRQENLLDTEYDDSFVGSNNILIRVRFLASLLRVADECDVTANRTPEVIYYSIKPEGASEEEFQKHLSISGIGKSAPYKLLLNGVAKSPKGVEVIERVRSQIQNQLNSVKAILANHGIILDLIEAHTDVRGFINKPIAFELDRKAIVGLLIGSSLYSREDVAVRELLQNAVDTCRLAKVVDSNFEPSIEIEFSKDQIAFEDNGIGMNFEDALEYFSRKGSSFYVSKDLSEFLKDKKFSPISKFGIGVLSSFMLADRMTVETKKANCAPCRFTITDLVEGWTYEEGSRQKTGTKVTLFLNERGRKIDIEKSLLHYAKSVTIPIFVKNSETGERRKLEQVWNYNMQEVLEQCSTDEREKFSQSKPVLTFHTTTPDLEVTCYVFAEMPFSSHKNCFLLKHGIYVSNFELFPSARSNWAALINCTSDMVDLTVSRENMVENDKFKGFLGAIYENLFNAVENKCGSISDSLDRCKEFSTYFNLLFFDSIGVEKESPQSLWFLKHNTKRIYPVLLKSGLSFLSGDQIFSRGFSKIIHYRLPLAFCKEHIEVVSQIFPAKMNENEAAVFDLGPRFQFIQRTPRRFLCTFCEIGKSTRTTSIDCCELPDFILKLEFPKESTPIDSLLPAGSYFTHMPSYLRSLTAQLKQFEFAPSLEATEESSYVRKRFYYSLVARELFSGDPELAKLYEFKLPAEEKSRKLVSSGQFVYDVDDQFLRFIISKAEIIFSNGPTKKLVERYLKSLAISYQDITYVGIRHQIKQLPDEVISLTVLEKTIAEMLDYSEHYIPITDRMGQLTSIYNATEF